MLAEEKAAADAAAAKLVSEAWQTEKLAILAAQQRSLYVAGLRWMIRKTAAV